MTNFPTRWCYKFTIANISESSTHNIHTYTRLTALFPGLPRWADTRKVKPMWILLKQKTVSGSGISWAICKSAPLSRQIITSEPNCSVFYRPDALPATQPTMSKHWRQRVLPTIWRRNSVEKTVSLSRYVERTELWEGSGRRRRSWPIITLYWHHVTLVCWLGVRQFRQLNCFLCLYRLVRLCADLRLDRKHRLTPSWRHTHTHTPT